jgi:hypothetical protein
MRVYQRNQEHLLSLPIPLGEMYTKLLSIGHMTHLSFPPLKPPFLNWYKLDLTCEYYTGNPDHNIDTCSTFERKLLQLFKTRWIAFEDIPNINFNPLPNYTSNYGGVNVVKFKRKKKVFKVTMDRLYDIVQVEYLPTKK